MYFCFIVSFLLPTSALRDDHFMPELVQVGDSLHFVKGSNPLLVPEVPEVPEVHGRSAARLFEHLDNSEKPTPLGVTALKNDGFGEQSDESPEDFIHSFDSSEQIQGILAGISDTGSYEIFNSHLQVEDSNRLVESVNFGSKLTGASRWLMKRRHRNRRNFDGSQQGEIQSEKDDTDWYPNFSEAERGEIGENSILAGMIAEFMADSQMQLVVDLDLFRTLFADPRDRFDGSVKTGDDSYVRQLLSYLEPLKEYDISAPCLADIGYFLWSAIEYARSIRESNCLNCSCDGRAHDTKQHQWIFNVVDALGKVPAGILGGNNLWIGSWSACRRISVIKNRQGQRWNGQYCMARFQPFNKDNPLKNIGSSDVPDPTAQCRQSTTVRNSSSNEEEDDNKCFDLIPLLNYGLCTPDSCTAYDTKKIIDFIYKSAEALIGREVVCNVDIVCRNDLPESQMSHDKMSMTVLFFLIFIVILMTFSTLYDCIVYQKELITAADQEAFYDEQNWFVKVLLSFSLYTNGKSILKTDRGAKQIHCLHGTRVLSMFWIILGHTYYYVVTSLTVDNLLPTIIAFPQKFLNLIIVQAPLAVDSFFYLSGMLTSYLFMEKFKIEAAKGKSIFAADMWSLFYIHRYIRLTPIYLVIMILDVTLFTYISDGPFWRSIEANYCRKSWWTNLIYLNNFLLQDTEICMGWTWYLANDMQFHFFAPIFLILFYKSGILGIAACIAVIFASSLVHLTIVLVNDYPPAPILTADLQIVKVLETYWPDVYVKPYIRCAPYIAGMIVGFSLYKCGLHPVIAKWKIALGWTISIIFGFCSVFSLYDYARTGEISEWMRVGYVLLGRNGYALSLAWVTFACATGYGGPINSFLSWRAWIPLSRITFCAYLIHPVLLQIYNFSRPHPFHFTTVYQMLYLFAVAIVMAYFTGFFLSLAFEVPVSIIEALAVNKIMTKLRRRKPKKIITKEDDFTSPENRVEVKLIIGETSEKRLLDLERQQNGNSEN